MATAAPACKPAIDKNALRKKYREERDKRLRDDGNDQYLELKDQLAHYLADPYTQHQPQACVSSSALWPRHPVCLPASRSRSDAA